MGVATWGSCETDSCAGSLSVFVSHLPKLSSETSANLSVTTIYLKFPCKITGSLINGLATTAVDIQVFLVCYCLMLLKQRLMEKVIEEGQSERKKRSLHLAH